MKRLLIAVALALCVSGCSTAQLTAITTATTTYDNAVQNFNAAVLAINGSIALTSQTVGPYCSAAQVAGQNLVKLASSNSKVVTALNTVAAALNQFCIGMPEDVQGAIVTLTNAAVAAKQAAQGA